MLQFPSQSVHVSQLCNYVDREKEGIERKREMIVALKLQCTVKILFPNKQTNNNDLFVESLQGNV